MADVLAVRDEYRAQNWAMVIQECNSSGLSNREFCRQRGISEKTYYYWLRKLRSQMAEVAAPQLVQLEPPPVPIQDDMLQIQYRGAELKLPAGVDMDAVAALMRSLQLL
jgi:putative transposase